MARQEENSSKTSPRLRTHRLHQSVREQNQDAVFIIRWIGEPEHYVVQILWTPVMLLKAKASLMMASMQACTLACRIRCEFADILNRAEGRGTGIWVRKTAKVVLGRKPSACKSSVSTPRMLPENGNGRRRVRHQCSLLWHLTAGTRSGTLTGPCA